MSRVPKVEGAEDCVFASIMTEELRTELDSALKTLTPKEQHIFLSHSRDGVSYADLADYYHITESRARQIFLNAVSHLRHFTSLKQYLEMF